MKILIVGLGSIGQRHLRNIKRLLKDEAEIIAYRVRRYQQTFSDNMTIREGVNLEKEYNIKVYDELNLALDACPDVVFITNITSEHINIALEVAKRGIDIFLEKPVSNSMTGVLELEELAKKNNIVLYIGYQNRFNPCLGRIEDALNKKTIGEVISVESIYGERLSTMHSYEDYRGTYIANASMGGGPILSLQIHCLDYLQLLFGKPRTIFSMLSYSNKLDVDVEDAASCLIGFEQETGKMIPVYCHTDFFQFPPKHTLSIIGTTGKIEADFNKYSYYIHSYGEIIEETIFSDFDRNDMFIKELEEFFECIKTRKQPDCNISQGIIGLKMAMAEKDSFKMGTIIRLEI